MGIIPVSIRRTEGKGRMLDHGVKGSSLKGSSVKGKSTTTSESEYVDFVTAGTQAAGAYHCSECGYGITVHAELPKCPMCAGTTWELHDWSPFTQPSRLQ
jgi:lipopolysaccharide biosynthesis regulator YciM